MICWTLATASSVRYDNPLKQGLKRPRPDGRVGWPRVRYDNPLKQGLKHLAYCALDVPIQSDMTIH